MSHAVQEFLLETEVLNRHLYDSFFDPLVPYDLLYCRMSESRLAAFFDKIEVDADGCWIWTGCLDRDGYGKVHLGIPGSKLTGRAHRVLWQHLNGPLISGDELDHECFKRACVHPAHLSPCTPTENKWRRRKCRTRKRAPAIATNTTGEEPAAQ